MHQRTPKRFVRSTSAPPIAVRARSKRASLGLVDIGGRHFRCALGRTGSRSIKREGDGATPMGLWRPVAVRYRADRGVRPRTVLPLSIIRRDDGWCDAPADRNYNRQVRLPYPASAEHLWRDDHLYDLVVILDHNRMPRRRNGGSAIFMHLARPSFTPTEGCIALSPQDMRCLLARMTPHTRLRVFI